MAKEIAAGRRAIRQKVKENKRNFYNTSLRSFIKSWRYVLQKNATVHSTTMQHTYPEEAFNAYFTSIFSKED